VGLVATGILAVLVSSAAQFTSAQGSEEVAIIARIAGGTIDLSGLLLAAVIFGGLGVLNDVAITQAVTIGEFRSIDPTMSRPELYRRAMSVGTAHLAATVNTLVFAYLGSALPVIVLLALQIHRLDLAINDEHIAVEVVRTVVGAIGVLSAVPLTTAIAAWWSGPAGRPATTPRWIMAMPLARVAVPEPVAAAAVEASKPGRRAALRRLVPRRRSKKTGPVEAAVEAAVDAKTPRTDALEPDPKPAAAGALDTEAPAAEAPGKQPRKVPGPRSAVGRIPNPAPTVEPPFDDRG
jgi:hypothetical protein